MVTLDCQKLTQYNYPEKCVFSVVFNVINEQGQIYGQGFEALGSSAVDAYIDATNQLIKFNKKKLCTIIKFIINDLY